VREQLVAQKKWEKEELLCKYLDLISIEAISNLKDAVNRIEKLRERMDLIK